MAERIDTTIEHPAWKVSLRIHHNGLRTGILVANVLPALRPWLTDAEYSNVDDKQDNCERVDELVRTLLTKDENTFHGFCDALETNGCPHWANTLRGKDCKAVVSASFSDSLIEMNDHLYLTAAMRKAVKERKLDPCSLIKALYASTYLTVVSILERNAHNDNSMNMARAVRTVIELRLADGDAEALPDTLTMAELLKTLSISTKWDDTCFLSAMVSCLPEEAKTLAMHLLYRYGLYLNVYDEAVNVKDSLKMVVAAPEVTNTEIPVEVTLAKDLIKVNCIDCKEILIILLCAAFKIPQSKIKAREARSGNSTTVVFIIDKVFMPNMIQFSAENNTLWAYMEFGVTRIRIPGLFEVNVSQLVTQHFRQALLSGLTGNMDFVRATKALPYQVYALVDPDTAKQLLDQTIRHELMRPQSEEEESEPGTTSEGVEHAPEISEGGLPSKVEEGEDILNEKKGAACSGCSELLTQVQELKGELKESERKMWDLVNENMALRNKQKASEEVERDTYKKLVRTEEELLTARDSQEEQILPLHAPPEAPPQSLKTPSKHGVEDKIKELAAQVQQAKDEKLELEMEISDLKKNLIQQAEKYDHDMDMISKNLPTSDPVTTALLNAAAKGSQSVVQHLVKRFANVKDKDGRTPLLLAAERGYTDLVKKFAGCYEGDIFHKMENSRNALHLAAYRGHLPVLQYLCPMFGERVLDRDGNEENCLDIAYRLGRTAIADFLTENYPQLEGKGGFDRDPESMVPRDPPKRTYHRQKHLSMSSDVAFRSGARHNRWWLKVLTNKAVPSSFSMELAEGRVEMEGEVEFRGDPKSKLMKAVSGTEWMYHRGALERGRQAAALVPRLHQFNHYHQRWLADSVLEEEEKSCNQWLLHQSPDVTTVKEAEEYRPERVRYRYTTTATKPLHTRLGCFYSKECIQGNPLLASATMQYVPLYLVQPEQLQPVAGRVEDEVAAHLARGGVEQVPLEKVPIKYEDLLSFSPATGISRKRILIEGVPGIGKSTLVQRMCHDWSIGHFAQEYKLVVRVNLRCLPKGEKLSLEDLVFTSIENPNIVKEVVQFITTHKGRDVLFVFDGFDEMSRQMQKESIIRSIMDGHIAPLSSFVVTSRPITAELLYSCVERRVDICGFGEEEVKESVRSYFARFNPLAGEKLLSSLSFNHPIKRLCSVPIQLQIICYTASLGDDSPWLPPTLHALFERLILHTVNHNLERAGRVERANSLNDIMQICPSFNQLAELARKGIENDAIIFSDLSFEVDSALHGLFNCFEVRNRNGVITRTWHFLHLALQEFMAALEMHKKTPEEQVTFWEQHLSLKYNKEGEFTLAEDRYQMMFLIYCGLSTLSDPGIQKMLMDACVCTIVKPTIIQGTALPRMCEAIAESGNEQFARSILSSCGSTMEIHGHLLGNKGVAWCLSQHFKPMNRAGIRVRGDSAIPLPTLARFLSHLEEVSTLAEVEIRDLQVVDGNMYDLQTIRQFLLKLKQLQSFTFEVKCKDVEQFSSNKDLSDTQDEVKTMDLIATLKDVITQHMGSLEELTLAIEGDPASDYHQHLIKSLEACKKLKSLNLKHVTLSSQDLVAIVQALHNLIALKLKSVHLSDEKDSTSSVISSSVAQHPSLKEMTVKMSHASTRCSDSLFKGIVEGISKRCGVEKLALVWHPKIFYELIFPVLAILNGGTLKKLRLGVELNPSQPEYTSEDPATSLSQLIVTFLLPQLSHCTDLQELKVLMSDRSRMFTSSNVKLLPPAIKDELAKCTKLQKLTVKGTDNWNVLPPVTVAFLHVMTCIRPLEEMTLKWCVFDGIDEAVMMFADFMKDSQLRRVEMSYCVGLSPLHIAAICKSVQSLNTLEELIISSVSMMGQKDSREKTDDVSDPEILQSVEKAVRENTSLKTIRIDCVELSWTNITVAILKGLITNASLKDVELVVPRQFPAVLPVMVEEVREAKSKLRLVVRAGYNYFL